MYTKNTNDNSSINMPNNLEREKESLSRSILKRHENVTKITKPEGIYTIQYALHETRYIDPSKFGPDTNAVVLETGDLNYALNKQAAAEITNLLQSEDQLYKPLVTNLSKRNIPIVYADIYLEQLKLTISLEILSNALETYIGIELVNKALKKIKNEEQMSRRDFLKIGGQLAASCWFLTPFLSKSGRTFSGYTGSLESLTAKYNNISHKIHPELDLFWLKSRNTLLAHKQEFLARKMGNQPNLGTIIGSMHTDLETEIQRTPEKRLQFLERIAPILKQVISPETFYSIAITRYNQKEKEWQMDSFLEVPELKKIIQP
jgi:hypothetical protein